MGVYKSSKLADLNQLFARWIFILGLFKLNIEFRQDTKKFWTAELWSTHVITLDIDGIGNRFSWSIFCAIHIKQVIDLREVRTGNL